MRSLKCILMYILWICITGYALPIQSQNSLSNNANSVVLDSQTDIICKSSSQAVRREARKVMVLNSKGIKAASFFCYCDMFNSLQKFSGEIVDAKGQVIRKIKKNELQKSEYSPELSSDDYYYYYDCNLPNFPFTVRYEWEVKCSNGLITYPNFIPQNMYYQAVTKAGYRIELPLGEKGRYRVVNGKSPIQIEQETTPKGQVILKASVTGLPAIVPEPFSPSMNEIFPSVLFSPNEFEYAGTKGKTSTWEEYGTWQYGLLNGRDQLPEAFRKKLHEMVSSCTNDREKVKVIYDYLANTTRYVSIQLGIGGLQPFAAADVCRTGFGDCKGLSNYMRSMLKEVGIPSNYTIINTETKRIFRDFASANQMNHVILQVPLPQDTLWLECTNPRLPFGYVHSHIAGHDAILITENGGKVYQLPVYPDSSNTQNFTASVSLTTDCKAEIQVKETSRLFQYENCAGIINQELNKKKEWLRNRINLPDADVDNIRINENKDPKPSITMQYAIRSEQYGNKTGNRLFVPINIFRKEYGVPSPIKRVHDIQINYGYADTDSICLKIPEDCTIEGLPYPVDIQTKFGSFHSSVKVEDKDIHIIQKLFMPQGVYPVTDYEAFSEFRKQIAGYYNARIVLKQK